MRFLLSPLFPTPARPGAAALALGLHAGIIAAAMGHAGVSAGPTVEPPPIVLPVLTGPLDGPPGAPSRGAPVGPAPLPPAPADPIGLPPPLDPLALPEPGSTRLGARPGPVDVILRGGAPGGRAIGPPDEPTLTPPVLLGRLDLRFPPQHRPGLVDVEYVIDTTGRMDPSSYHVVGHPDAGLAALVEEALRNARFRPARIGDHVVSVRVRQRFRFEQGDEGGLTAPIR